MRSGEYHHCCHAEEVQTGLSGKEESKELGQQEDEMLTRKHVRSMPYLYELATLASMAGHGHLLDGCAWIEVMSRACLA